MNHSRPSVKALVLEQREWQLDAHQGIYLKRTPQVVAQGTEST